MIILETLILQKLFPNYLSILLQGNSSVEIYMGYKFYVIKFFRTKNKNNSHFCDFHKWGCDKVFFVIGKVTVGKEYILIDE